MGVGIGDGKNVVFFWGGRRRDGHVVDQVAFVGGEVGDLWERRQWVWRGDGGVQGLGSQEPSLAFLHRKPGECNISALFPEFFFSYFEHMMFVSGSGESFTLERRPIVLKCSFRSRAPNLS